MLSQTHLIRESTVQALKLSRAASVHKVYNWALQTFGCWKPNKFVVVLPSTSGKSTTKIEELRGKNRFSQMSFWTKVCWSGIAGSLSVMRCMACNRLHVWAIIGWVKTFWFLKYLEFTSKVHLLSICTNLTDQKNMANLLVC